VSAVTASEAQRAGEQAAPHLEARHVYVDINSVSPAAKQAVDRAVTARGARFVEAAVMSPVPGLGHQVPMLLCGSGARAFSDLMTAHGMRLELLEGPVGSASAIKMFRSVVIKGLEALMLECLMGAEQFGAGERVFASVSASFPGIDWNKLAHYMIGRTAIHAERRMHEMEEVARTLADVGVDPIMALATVRRLKTCADLDLKTHFDNREPADYRDVVQAIAEGCVR
jgi:3-hydroxyisobutyrate dehydrogenase